MEDMQKEQTIDDFNAKLAKFREDSIIESKQLRVDLDAVLQRLKESGRKGRERSLSITKIQEAIMWLGMDLKALNVPTPYPNSYDTSNTIVDPTADGLKM